MKKLWLLTMLAWPMVGFGQHVVLGVHVGVPPPALRAEVRPIAPSPQAAWVPGYWAWRGRRHVWVAGRWAVPPSPGYVWEPAIWRQEGGQWVFYEGHWRSVQPPQPTYVYAPPPTQEQIVTVAPPPPLREVPSPVPFPGALWIPGFWNWNGVRHVWVAGRWSSHPKGYVWQREGWRQLPNGRWKHVHGHWKRG